MSISDTLREFILHFPVDVYFILLSVSCLIVLCFSLFELFKRGRK